MRVTYALEQPGDNLCRDNFPNCLRWAQARACSTGSVVKIIVARPGERFARIVAEVTSDGVRASPSHRVIPMKRLRLHHG